MTREQEFRKQTEEAKFESFAVMCKKVAVLEKENAELKEQIEKMRNFQNCDYQLHIIDCPIFKSGGHISCKKCPHWILQETDE